MNPGEDNERSVEDIEKEDPGPLLDPAGGPLDEGLIGIYEDPLEDLNFDEEEEN